MFLKPLIKKMKNLNTFHYIMIGFVLSVGMYAYNRLTDHLPLYMEQMHVFKPGSTYTIDLHPRKSGCYEVGIASDEGTLTRHKMDGSYRVQYLVDGSVVIDRNISGRNGARFYSDTSFTRRIIDAVEIPIGGQKKFSVRLTLVKPESDFSKKNDDFYFYVDYAPDLRCGKAQEAYEKRKYIKSLTIDVPETNATLVPLYEALKTNETGKAISMFEAGMPVNVAMIANRTPMHFAAYYDDLAIVKYLVNHGADIEKKDLHNITPLGYAIQGGSIDTVKYLMSKGADLEDTGKLKGNNPFLQGNGVPPLFYTSCTGMYEMTEYLLQNGVEKKQIVAGANAYEFLNACIDDKDRKVREEKIEKMQTLLHKYGLDLNPNRHIIFDKEIR